MTRRCLTLAATPLEQLLRTWIKQYQRDDCFASFRRAENHSLRTISLGDVSANYYMRIIISLWLCATSAAHLVCPLPVSRWHVSGERLEHHGRCGGGV